MKYSMQKKNYFVSFGEKFFFGKLLVVCESKIYKTEK